MSITYSGDVANTKIWTFIKILFKWKGSVFRTIWIEMIVFVLMYEFIAINFHYVFTKEKFPLTNEILTSAIKQFQLGYNTITVAFVLGFYVSMVVGRWYDQQSCIPWTDDIAVLVSAFVSGDSERPTHIRRTVMRYLNAAYLLGGREVFEDIKKQFPDDKQIIKAGFLTEREIEKLYKVETDFCRYFVPITWALKLICKAREENLIKADRTFDKLIDRITDFRGQIGGLWLIDQINPPLCYAQVAGISVYGFLFGALMAYQKLEYIDINESNLIKIIIVTFPPFELFVFVFYIGWYKIAENLTNPYGNTEYNFDVIYSLQRNLQMAFLIVDQLHNVSPPILDEILVQNIELDNSQIFNKANPLIGSLNNFDEIEVLGGKEELTEMNPEKV